MCRGRASIADAPDSKSSTQDQISSREAEKSQAHITSRRKSKILLYEQVSGTCEACGDLNWNHELETHRIPERTVRRVKEGTSSLLHSVWTLRKLVGQQQWSSITISEMSKSYQQMARRPMNDGSIHHSAGRLFHLKQK